MGVAILLEGEGPTVASTPASAPRVADWWQERSERGRVARLRGDRLMLSPMDQTCTPIGIELANEPLPAPVSSGGDGELYAGTGMRSLNALLLCV
jgi:hypothetical protein